MTLRLHPPAVMAANSLGRHRASVNPPSGTGSVEADLVLHLDEDSAHGAVMQATLVGVEDDGGNHQAQ